MYNIDRFCKNYKAVSANSPASMKEILDARGTEEFGGMTSHEIQIVLNYAVSCLSYGEKYLELGTFAGLTLISAAIGNEYFPNGTFIGVDDYSELGDAEDKLRYNLTTFDVASLVAFYRASFQEFFSRDDIDTILDGGVGVFFYDAAHDIESTVQGFELVRKHLAPQAIVFVDDSIECHDKNSSPPWLGEPYIGVQQLLQKYDELTLVALEGWHLGFTVLRYTQCQI